MKLTIADFEQPPLLGASNEDMGVWLKLLKYCARQENGGKIMDCKNWPDVAWMQAAGIMRSDVMRDSPLWWWKDSPVEMLVIANYPIVEEDNLKLARKSGKQGALKRWRKKKTRGENGEPNRDPIRPPNGD